MAKGKLLQVGDTVPASRCVSYAMAVMMMMMMMMMMIHNKSETVVHGCTSDLVASIVWHWIQHRAGVRICLLCF